MERWQLVSEVMEMLEDEGFRPHVVLQTRVPGTCGVPENFIKENGHVVLNLSRNATGDTLRIGMYQCAANLTFNGQHGSIAWHPDAVVAVYSPDGGPKLVFEEPDPDKKPVDRRKPHLTLVSGPDWGDGPHGSSNDDDNAPLPTAV